MHDRLPPHAADLALLHDLACGHAASVVAERRGFSLAHVAVRAGVLRQHYGVSSTAAAAHRALQLGHLPRSASTP